VVGAVPVHADVDGGDKPRSSSKTRELTLLTGDRVTVTAGGDVRSVRRGAGRDGIPVSVRTVRGHTYVVPADAESLIGAGRLDPKLFDVTELVRPAFRRLAKSGLPLIVNYRSAHRTQAREGLRRAGADSRRVLPSIKGEAMTAKREDSAAIWKSLTEPGGGGKGKGGRGKSALSTAPGISHVWLDGLVRPALNDSTKQIGAPAAWAKDFTGKGVTIAVLDTGIDQTHPDLSAEAAEKNFTEEPDAVDRHGHGTHAASIAAGTGAKSGGTYRGVAPDARLLDGKVMESSGAGMTSWIVAGMEWAAAEHADVVSLSLGSEDLPGLDPLEAAVEALSAAPGGPLFVVAAGNFGPGPGTIDSPGSAPSALTVGAVDKKDALAEFSSRGPTPGDRVLKPDLTAPGVGIAAAKAAEGQVGDPVTDGYVRLDGTSMATPHVAGAAALLAQRHPDWSGQRLKSALVGSVAPGPPKSSALDRGSGRVDAERAVSQSLLSESSSLGFGTQLWPHQDDKPVSKQVVYRNTGAQPITLDLRTEVTGPDGDPAPSGVFGTDRASVTVPAGGTASVDLTADTRIGGSLNGVYSATVVATGGGQTVRTAATVEREVESYDLTVPMIGRDGGAAQNYYTGIAELDTDALYEFYDTSGPADGVIKARLPKGRYLLDARQWAGPGDGDDDATYDYDWVVRPEFTLNADTTLAADARTTKQLDVTVPDAGARSVDAVVEYRMYDKGYMGGTVFADGFEHLRTVNLGPPLPASDQRFKVQLNGLWDTAGGKDVYSLAKGRIGSMYSGLKYHAAPSELATLDTRVGASVAGRQGRIQFGPQIHFAPYQLATEPIDSPFRRKVHVNAKGVRWSLVGEQIVDHPDGMRDYEADYRTEPIEYRAGSTTPVDLNIGVFGPLLTEKHGLFREGDLISGGPRLLGDGAGHDGSWTYDTARTELFRNGVSVGKSESPLGEDEFTVPSEAADYRLNASLTRSGATAVSTRIDAEWTFRSGRTAERSRLPLSVVRFAPKLSAGSTAPAGAPSFAIPVRVQGPSGKPRSLRVEVSTDGGAHWSKSPVVNGKYLRVRNPAAGGTVSLRARLVDGAGNALKQTVMDAYRTA
jgi:subtilisin family serine protease